MTEEHEVSFRNSEIYIGTGRGHIVALKECTVVLADEENRETVVAYDLYYEIKYGVASEIDGELEAYLDYLAQCKELTIKGLASTTSVAVNMDLHCLQCAEQSALGLITQDQIYKGLLVIMPLCGPCHAQMGTSTQKVETVRAILRKQYQPEGEQ